jgi:Spy/CpxP family protein refolding chaperone
MSIKRALAVFLAVVALTAAPAGRQTQAPRIPTPDPGRKRPPASEPPRDPLRSKWWQDEACKAQLHLTPEQSAVIEDLWQGAWRKARDVMAELRKREDALSDLINGGNTVTDAQVLKAAIQVEAIRSDLFQSHTLMLFRMRRVLTPAQRTTLAEIARKFEQERSRGGARQRGPRLKP